MLFNALFASWDQWLAQRAALRLIEPLLAGTVLRRGAIPEVAWREPYIVGFLTMLISLIAVERTRGRISGERLGLVQLAVWRRIAALKDERVGEDILLLSANADRDFLQGCANARRFLAYARGAQDIGDSDLDTSAPLGEAAEIDFAKFIRGGGEGLDRPDDLWVHLFEARLPESLAPNLFCANGQN